MKGRCQKSSFVITNLVLLCLIGMSVRSLENDGEDEDLSNELQQTATGLLDGQEGDPVELPRQNVPRAEPHLVRERQTSSSLSDQPSSSAQAPPPDDARLREVFRPLAMEPAEREPADTLTMDDLIMRLEGDQFRALLTVATQYADGVPIEEAASNAITTLDPDQSQTSILDPLIPIIYKTHFEDPCELVLSTYESRKDMIEFFLRYQNIFYADATRLKRLATICEQFKSPEMKQRIMGEIYRINSGPSEEASSSSSIQDPPLPPISPAGPTQASPAAAALEPEAEYQLASLMGRIRRGQFGTVQSVADDIRNGVDSIARSASQVLDSNGPGQTVDVTEIEQRYKELFLYPCIEILLVFNHHESRINYIISKRFPSIRPQLQQLVDMAEACRRLTRKKEQILRELRQMYENRTHIGNAFQS